MVCWVGGTLIGSVAGDALLVQAGTPADPDAGLRAWLRDWARNHPRRGFRPTYHDARAEGWQVNHKKVQRLP